MGLRDPVTKQALRKAKAEAKKGLKDEWSQASRFKTRDGRIRWERGHVNRNRYHAHTGLCPRERRPVWKK